jgi:hypothetical protein
MTALAGATIWPFRESHLVPRLTVLKAESVHIFREIAAERDRPALRFSGGKDGIVLLYHAKKALWAGPISFPVPPAGAAGAAAMEERKREGLL